MKKNKSETVEFIDADKIVNFFVSDKPEYNGKYAVLGRVLNGNLIMITSFENKEHCIETVNYIRDCYVKGNIEARIIMHQE